MNFHGHQTVCRKTDKQDGDVGKYSEIATTQVPIKNFVIPAQAGIYKPVAISACLWIPACAGMTDWLKGTRRNGTC